MRLLAKLDPISMTMISFCTFTWNTG